MNIRNALLESKEEMAAQNGCCDAVCTAASTGQCLRFFFLMPAFCLWLSAATAMAFEQLPLQEAFAQGKISVKVEALGGSSGDVILLKVRRLQAEPLGITLALGTLFTNSQPSAQNMTGAQIRGRLLPGNRIESSTDIFLDTDQEQDVVIRAYCMDFKKNNPNRGSRFELGPPNSELTRILEMAVADSLDVPTIQAAVWIHNDAVKDEALKLKFPVTNEQLAAAHQLLQRIEALPPAGDAAIHDRTGPEANAAPAFVVTGHLLAITGTPISAAKVYLVRLDGSRLAVSVRRDGRDVEVVGSPVAMTDPSGTFQFRITVSENRYPDGQQLILAQIDVSGIRPLKDRAGKPIVLRFNSSGGAVAAEAVAP